MNPKDVTMITDDLRRADRTKVTYLQRGAIDMVQELHSGMSRNKSSCKLKQNVINKSDGSIKRRAMKSQKTTTKLCTITITQQYGWNQITESLYSLLRKKK